MHEPATTHSRTLRKLKQSDVRTATFAAFSGAELDRDSGEIAITQRLALQRAPGVPLTGPPNLSLGADANSGPGSGRPVRPGDAPG